MFDVLVLKCMQVNTKIRYNIQTIHLKYNMIPKPNIVHEVQSTIALTMEEKIRMFTWDSILAECIV